MFILITGVPGTGKTTISKYIKQNTSKKFKIINDKDFSKKYDLGYFDKNYNEIVVDTNLLNKVLFDFLKENKDKNIIFEGHLWSELFKRTLRNFDLILVLFTKEDLLRKRLEKRNYNVLKIEENIFCQNTDYIQNILLRKKIEFHSIKTTDNLEANFKRIKKYLF